MKSKWNSHYCLWKLTMSQACWKDLCQLLKILNRAVPKYDNDLWLIVVEYVYKCMCTHKLLYLFLSYTNAKTFNIKIIFE